MFNKIELISGILNEIKNPINENDSPKMIILKKMCEDVSMDFYSKLDEYLEIKTSNILFKREIMDWYEIKLFGRILNEKNLNIFKE